MLFCRPVETTCKAEKVLKLYSCLLKQQYRLPWEKFVGAYTDGNLTIFRSQSEFIAKMRKKPLMGLDLIARFTESL